MFLKEFAQSLIEVLNSYVLFWHGTDRNSGDLISLLLHCTCISSLPKGLSTCNLRKPVKGLYWAPTKDKQELLTTNHN